MTRETQSRGLLLVIGLVTVIAWQFPLGAQILFPFTLLATYAHEMGHGLTALLLGARFDALEMYANGSGLARWHGDVGRLGRALIAAGGLVGPSIAGAILLVLSRRTQRARAILFGLSALMLVSMLVFARSAFGFFFIGAAALVLGGGAYLRGGALAPFAVQLIGVELCLSVFSDVSYMFSPGGLVDGQVRPSDSAQIADALLLPYWFWGALTAAFSFLVLGLGLYIALRKRASLTGSGAPAPRRAKAAG